MTVAKITPTTGAALRKVFALLEDNFDADVGMYKDGWSDERIAKETQVSPNAVKEYRTSAFGKLKPPTELHKISQDLRELETLFLKTENEFREKIKDLKARVLLMQRKFD